MKINKIHKGNSEEVFETVVTDSSGRKLDKWKCNKKEYPKVIQILNEKYGFGLVIKGKDKKDIDWIFK